MRGKKNNHISIVGAGRVGSTLAVLLHRRGYRIVSVVSRTKKSAKNLARLVQCRVSSVSLSELHPSTQIIIIAVPEEAIPEIAKRIAEKSRLQFSSLLVFHTSGSVTSDTLSPLRKKGARTFSLHPIQSFSRSSALTRQLEQMENVTYGFEGMGAALPPARRLVKALGGRFIRIPKEEKILYHAAGVFASNYSVALLGVVDDIAKRIGSGLTLSHFEPLVRSSIENAFQQTPVQALTGPIVRGSAGTIKQQVQELQKRNTLLGSLYRQIGLQALKMAAARKSITPKTAKQIRQILERKRTIVKEEP